MAISLINLLQRAGIIKTETVEEANSAFRIGSLFEDLITELADKIELDNPHANLDVLYGPYNSLAEAKATVLSVLREKGLTVGVYESGAVVEYWWKAGTTDAHLVLKQAGAAVVQSTGTSETDVMSQKAVSDELKELYNKIKIEPVFTQDSGYDSSGNLFNTAEFQYTSFDVSEFAGGWLTISPALPSNFAGKSMIVSQTGVNTLFAGTYGSEIIVQLPKDAKDIKLSQYFNVANTTIWAYSNGFTTPFSSFESLKTEFDNFKDLDIIQTPVVNLFDKTTMVLDKKYINPATGSLDNAGTVDERVARVPLTAGTYSISIKDMSISYQKIFVETEIGVPDIANALLYNSLPYDQTGKGRVLTIANTNAKYLIFQVSVTAALDYRETLQIQKGTFISNYEPYKKRVSSIMGVENNTEYYGLFSTLTDMLKNNNLLYGKKLGVLGDSISYGYGLSDNNRFNYRNSYAIQLAEKNNMSINIDAVVGSHLAVRPDGETGSEFVNRWNNIDANCDYIIVFGGTNDVAPTTPIGEDSDTVKTTIKGALNIICSGIIDKAPTAKILFITPLNFIANTRVLQITNAIKTICAKYSIPVLDLYANGNYAPVIASQLLVYGEADGTDVYHPNQLYHSILARKIEKLID